MSPDGKAFAVEVARPLSAAGPFLGGDYYLDLRGDLWLLNGDLTAPRRLDALPGGAWFPSFSADGKRLSALTLMSPGKVGVVVWDADSLTHRTFSDCNVAMFGCALRTAHSAYGGPSGFFETPLQYLWLDATSILYVDYGDRKQQGVFAVSSLAPTLRLFRNRAEEGGLSVRVWSDHSPTCGAGGRLVRLECDTGKEETLYQGDVRGVSVSPDLRWVAVMAASANIPPVPDKPMMWPLRNIGAYLDSLVELKLSLIDLGPTGGVHDIQGVTTVGVVSPSRLPRWSSDSKRVAVPVRTTYSDAASTGNDAVWEISASTGVPRRWSASSALDAELLAALITINGLNTKRVIDERPQKIQSRDYADGGQISGGAWRCPGQQVLFWDSPELSIITADRRVVIQGNFTAVQPPAVWRNGATIVGAQPNGESCIVTVSEDGHYDIGNLQIEPDWTLLGVNGKKQTVVYKDDSDHGTFLILTKVGRRPRTSSLSFNTYFREILRPARRMLSLSFSDRATRWGTFVLPIGHRAGQRHPVVVWAYPDASPSLNDAFTKPNSYSSVIYPIQYLLARGFAFFQAPFPIASSSGSEEPMRAAVSAVLPWLEVLDRQAEVLSGEYGFFGHSNAGYVALALEALTHRFKAIVAWDTFPEIGFGTLHSWSADVALECAGGEIQADRKFYEDPRQPYSPGHAPPWMSRKKYIRNEPLFNLSRASTPLLLVEGEFDAAPREMEEVYSILFGSGVPVELANYWGESHVFASPGNIRDSWIRTESFFKKHLRMR
jgi:dipeptidyl aminopeptidase/acylaminoacyl peptidase